MTIMRKFWIAYYTKEKKVKVKTIEVEETEVRYLIPRTMRYVNKADNNVLFETKEAALKAFFDKYYHRMKEAKRAALEAHADWNNVSMEIAKCSGNEQ